MLVFFRHTARPGQFGGCDKSDMYKSGDAQMSMYTIENLHGAISTVNVQLTSLIDVVTLKSQIKYSRRIVGLDFHSDEGCGIEYWDAWWLPQTCLFAFLLHYFQYVKWFFNLLFVIDRMIIAW